MDYNKLRVEELKSVLSQRSLDTKGRKADLVARLIVSDHANSGANPPAVGPRKQHKEVTESYSIAAASVPTAAPGKFAAAAAPGKFAAATAPGKFAATAVTSTPDDGISEATSIVTTTTTRTDAQAIDNLSEAERLALRKEKFGIVDSNAEAAKSLARAQRFGIVTAELENEKRKARAARFNNSGISILVDDAEVEMRKKRAQRFQLSTPESEARKKIARADRFNLQSKKSDQEFSVGLESWGAKQAARKLRFGT